MLKVSNFNYLICNALRNYVFPNNCFFKPLNMHIISLFCKWKFCSKTLDLP